MEQNLKKTGWSAERRQKARERILKNKPWEKSTGPKTKQGKNITRYNAFKKGHHSVLLPHTRHLLKLNKTLLEFHAKFAYDLYFVAALIRAKEHQKALKNELINNHDKSIT